MMLSLRALAGLPLALLALSGCARETPAPRPERDPVIVTALNGPLMTDPDLVSQNDEGLLFILTGPPSAPVPLLDRDDDAIAAARAAAEVLAGGKLAAAPDPAPAAASLAGETAAVSARQGLAALGVPGGCAQGLSYTFGWAARLPLAVPVYPHGHAQEAAGNDAPGCRLRVVRYLTPVAPADVAAFYWNRASAARLAATRTAGQGEDQIVARGAGGGFTAAIQSEGDVTRVDVVTSGI